MTDDEREAYEERAGICEFHGELSREDAERVAREAIERARKGEPKGCAFSAVSSGGYVDSAPVRSIRSEPDDARGVAP